MSLYMFLCIFFYFFRFPFYFVYVSCIFVYIFIFCFYLPHRRENMQLLSFWAWLTSLSMMSSNSIHLPSNHMSLFPMAEFIHIYRQFLIRSLVVEHLGCFHSLAILNSAVMNSSVQVSLLSPVLSSFGWMPRSGITGSYGSSSFSFFLFIYF
jgi:hypothetical protein